jgi:integrase
VGSIPTLGSTKSQLRGYIQPRWVRAEKVHPRSIQDFHLGIRADEGLDARTPAGVWELIVQLPRDPTSARAGQLSRTVHGTKREAQRALAGLIGEVSAGKVTSTAMPLSELLTRWLDHVSEQLSPTTVREYRRPVRTMLDPDLGKLPLRRVTTQRIDAYYASLARERGLSPASIRHVHAVLRGALGQAMRWGWISSNAAASASPPKLRRREITPPPMHAARTLLETADTYDVDFGAVLRVLVATGARRGEVCGLRWSDVDVAGSTPEKVIAFLREINEQRAAEDQRDG